MFNGIRALIFDFDGTLVDASIPICHAFNAALERFGAAPIEENQIRQLIGNPLKDMFPKILPNLSDADIEQLIRDYREVFAPIACELSRPMPGLRDMVAYFRDRCRMGIATSRMSDGAQSILGAMALLDSFDVIVGLQDVQNAKPHPESVLKALAALDAAPEAGVMVGDVPGDMQAGKRAGTYTVGMVSSHYSAAEMREAGADTTISSLAELINLVQPALTD